MKVVVIREEQDDIDDCSSVLNEIKDKMEVDYPEITDYSVE